MSVQNEDMQLLVWKVLHKQGLLLWLGAGPLKGIIHSKSLGGSEFEKKTTKPNKNFYELNFHFNTDAM